MSLVPATTTNTISTAKNQIACRAAVKTLERQLREECESTSELRYHLEEKQRQLRSGPAGTSAVATGSGALKQERLRNEALKQDLVDVEKTMGALRDANAVLKAENLELSYEIQDIQRTVTSVQLSVRRHLTERCDLCSYVCM